MSLFQLFVGLSLFFVGYDVVLFDTFSIGRYVWYGTVAGDILFRFGYLVLIVIPILVGMCLRRCFPSWSFGRTFVVVSLYVGAWYVRVVVDTVAVAGNCGPGVIEKMIDQIDLSVKIMVVLAVLMAMGSGMVGLARNTRSKDVYGKTSP